MSDWTHDVVVNKREPAAVAADWIANNPALVDTWLGL